MNSERIAGTTPRGLRELLAVGGLRSRAVNGLWLFTDQGVFALSNFLINILFARQLAPTDYGWFVMSFSESLFIATLHYGVVLEPLLVQSAQVPWRKRRAYVTSLLYGHLILLAASILLGVIGLGIACYAGLTNVGWAFASGLVGGATIVTLITGRRLCLVFASARASALIGAGYLIGSVLTGLSLKHITSMVGWLDIWYVIAGWSLLGSIATFGLIYRCSEGRDPYPLAEVVRFGRRYAPWGCIASLFSWGRWEGLFFLLAHFCGLPVVAETRAIFNLAAPVMQGNMALQTSILVWFSRDRRNGSVRNLLAIIALHALGLALVLPIIAYFADDAVRLAYGGRYLMGAWQLPLFVVLLTINSLDSIVSNVSKARGRMASGYASQFAAGIAAMALGVLLIPVQGTLVFASMGTVILGLMVALAFRMRES